MKLVTKNYKGIDNTNETSDYFKDYFSKKQQRQAVNEALNKAPTKFSSGNWINTQALDDGFDWYDPLAMLGATTADITLDVLHGGLNTIEGMADTGQYLLADILEWGFGNSNTARNKLLTNMVNNPKMQTLLQNSDKPEAKALLKEAERASKKNWANNLADDIRANADYGTYDALFGKSQNPEDNIFGNWQEGLEQYSLAGDKLDQVNSSIGQMGTYALTGGITGKQSIPRNALVTFTSSYGNAKSQAKRNGASESDAVKKGLVSGIAETISENMFNAIPGFESAGWFDDILGKVMKKKAGKVATTLFEPLEEGFEEIVSNLLDVTGTYIVNYLDGGNWEYGMQGMSGNYLQDMWNTLKSPETWEAFFSAALSTSIVHLGNNAITNQQYNNAINKYAKENNVSVEQAKADFKEVLGAAVEDYSTDEMSSKEKYQLEQSLNKQLVKDVKKGLNLSDAALNVDRARMEKQANLPIIRNTFEESLVNHGINPNNEVWKSISKTLEKRGITGIVDEQYFNDNSENALIINDGNGNRIMAFNPNADTNTIVQANTVHELVHDLIASENSKRKLLGIKAGEEIKDSDIIKYFEKLDGYAEARADLEETYSKIKDKNGNLMYDPKSEEFSKMIDEEVVAKVLEKNLGTQETINRLVHENRNLAQRIYDWIMNKIKNRGGVIRDEELYWRNIQNRFVKAFNMEYENSTNEANTKFSIDVDNNGNKYVKVDTDQDIFEGVEPKDYNKIAKMYITDYLLGETKLSNDEKALIDRTGRNKYTNPGKKQQYFDEKMKLTPELKNVIEIAEKYAYQPKYKNNATYDNYEYYKFNFEINGNKFEGILNIGIDENGNKHFYEVNNIKKVEGISSVSTNSPSTSDNNVSQINENVKSKPNLPLDTKFSLPTNNKLDDYITEKGYNFKSNGNLEVKNLTDKQIKDLVKIYHTTGYEDVSEDYLKEMLKRDNPILQREVADRFIEKELGYKPKYDTTKIYEDAEGNKLTKEQVEFYKDSDVRDIRGRLIPVYHRTNADFTVFDSKAGKQHGSKYGKGFYFSITPENYGNNTMKLYLNASEGDYKYVPKMGYYIVQNPNQIKDINNKKPTSNPDIRMSKESKAFDEFINKNLKDTGTTGDLMAIHNLNEDKLKGMLELGGTAYPSIAITTPSTISHEGYGDISVLFDKSTIDPANKLNKVYSRDAYTPRFPTIEYKLDSNVKRQIRETIGDYDYRNVKPGDEYISDAYGIMDNIEDNINRSGLDRALEDVKNNDAMKYVYLKNTNPDFKVETKNETYSQKYNNETLQRFIDNYDGEYELNDIPGSEVEKYVSKMVDAYKQQLETEKGNENDLSQKLIDVRLDKLRNEFYEKSNFLMAAYKLQKYGTEKQVLDKQATREKMNNMINQEEYNQWVDKLFENIIEKKGLRNNKDYYTSSGNPRSFEQLHDEYTLNNVVKIMSELNDTGEEGGFFYGISEIAGNASQRFNTIEDIKANKNLLTTVGDEEYHQILDNMQERLSKIEENVMERGQNNSDNYFIARDNMASVIADAARIFGEGKKIDANKIQKMLKEYGFEVTTEESQKILDMFSEMRNLPTQYFEAKPQRAVGLDEVQAVVIPNTASESLRKQLNDAGFDFVEYDPNVEGDRQRVINKFDNLKFNKNSQEWDAFVNKHTTTKGTRTKLGDTKLPMAETNLPIDNEFANYLDTKFQDLQKQIDEIKPKNQEVNLPTEKNTTKKEKTTMPLRRIDDVLKVSTEIAKEINETNDFKLRSWAETSTESELLKDKVFIEDLDPGKITYEVLSNKKSLEAANRHLDTYGYDKTLDYVKNIIQSDKLPSASDVALMQRMIQEASKRGDIDTVQNLIMETAIVGTDLGQATQALSMIQRLTPEGQLKLYTKLIQRAKARGEKAFNNVEITPEMVQKILEVYNQDGTYDQNKLNEKVEEFKQDIAKQMKTTTMEKLDAWRYLAMLGNPKTHIRNMISNVAMKGTLKVKNAVARTLETILPVKERTKTWKNATPEIKQYAKNTAIEMKDIIQGKAKYNEKSQLEAEKQIFKSKALEKVRKANSNALEFEDWLFSKSAFIKTFQEYLTANNIRTKEDIRNNPKLVQKAKNYAVEQAEIATFRQYSKIASMIGKIERSNKGAKFIIGATLPFKKTPINVAKTGLSYSPLGLIKNMTYDTYRLVKGDINASQYIDNISQGMTGSTLTLLGYAFAKSGFLSGSGDDDKEGKYDSQLGNSQYSINIGGKSYSISWLSPVAMPLLVGANAYEQLEENKEWDMNVISDTLAKTLDPLNEMSFLQGLTNALQSYGSGMDKLKGSLESISQNYIGQFFPTLFSQIASVTDDKKRSTKASNNSSYKFGEQTLRSIMYKLPGARQQLEVATDVWGNEKLQSDNIVERAFESFIAPYSKTEHISTDLDNELKKVYNETGENKVLPTVPYGYIKYKDETYKMSASEFTEFKKDYGQTANKMLNNLINTQTYKDASYEEKADMIDEIYEYAREKAKENYFKSIDQTYESDKLEKYKKVEYITSYDKYIGYKGQIDAIKKKYKSTDDMTSKQKTAMNKKRKEEVQKYINSLSLNRQQKLMLQKFAGGYSVKDYKKELQNYINSLKISKADKETLDKELFG